MTALFSIIIPSWNNLELLKFCIGSIQKNSKHFHQIIVHLNEGSDGSLEWVRKQGFDYTHSPHNIGICLAMNEAAMLVKTNYILYLNDDMYCCPDWDEALHRQLKTLDTDLFMLSGTMIEPLETGNKCVSIHNYGRDPDSFQEKKLLENFKQHYKANWYGATWPPTLVHAKWWFKVGGYSSEFSPGMSSDNDFSMKLWHAGCRIFIGVGDSLVYHFQSKSTGKIKKNDGRRQFLNKWGLAHSVFDRFYLRRGTPIKNEITLSEPLLTMNLRLQLLLSQFKRRFT
jgi:glycosyltransferase involved in cell wall biosynthesis